MEPSNLLILDFCPTLQLSLEFTRAWLDGVGPGHELAVLTPPDLGVDGHPGGPSRFCSSCHDADALVFCVSAANQEKAIAFFTTLRQGGCLVPVFVVGLGLKPLEFSDWICRGAADFALAPISAAEVAARVPRLKFESPRTRRANSAGVGGAPSIPMIGSSPSFLAEIARIPRIAQCDASVLILGETGTGKELCARSIHHLGLRGNKPFAPVNCGAIPLELVENELFGHVAGAYTGATGSAEGIVQSADGGTLFLDEVDCLPLASQVKLLRFLQTREFRPVGSPRLHRADIRIIAASNADLSAAVQNGRFRQDLYYRLNVLSLRLPPLRDRIEDIPALACNFLERFAEQYRKAVRGFTPEAIQRLFQHDWPGNVRELENVVERATVNAEHSRIQPDDISLQTSQVPSDATDSFRVLKARTVSRFERSYIQGLLLAHDGNISRAARAARKNRRAFWELIRKHGITVRPGYSTETQQPRTESSVE